MKLTAETRSSQPPADPALRAALTRLFEDRATPEDMATIDASGTPSSFMARVMRLFRRMNAAREQARKKLWAALDPRTGSFEALQACREEVIRSGVGDELLPADERPEPWRVVGCLVGPGCALDLESEDEAIVVHDVVQGPKGPVLVGMTMPEDRVPRPRIDEADEDRIASAIADAVIAVAEAT
jgi:hypothetical protein